MGDGDGNELSLYDLNWACPRYVHECRSPGKIGRIENCSDRNEKPSQGKAILTNAMCKHMDL